MNIEHSLGVLTQSFVMVVGAIAVIGAGIIAAGFLVFAYIKAGRWVFARVHAAFHESNQSILANRLFKVKEDSGESRVVRKVARSNA